MTPVDDLKLYGGPGCGKTRQGLNWLIDRVREGADVERVAFVSYTNAAVDEAKERVCQAFDVAPDDLPYSRTLHSLAFRMLNIQERDWCADRHLGQFGEERGYDLKANRKTSDGDLEETRDAAGSDSAMLAVWDFARNRLITDPEAGYAAFADYDPDATARIPRGKFLGFVEHYEGWKQTSGLRDYTDLLLELLDDPQSLPVSVAVVDEAQDLSPLMWRVADTLFADAELRATLGDDDQAIYSFSGAAPELMNRRKSRETVKLRQSYRLPNKIVAAANWIIEQNQDREPKEIIPMAGSEGAVQRVFTLDELALDNGESWFLLVRNWKLLSQYTDYLDYAGIPYHVLGNRYSPWDDKGPWQAVQAILALSAGKTITMSELWPLVQKTPAGNSKRLGAWEHGAKKRIEELVAQDPSAPVTWRELFQLRMTTEAFNKVMHRDLTLLDGKISQRDLRAYQAMLNRYPNGLPEQSRPQVKLGSIHSVKGKEAQNVVVLLGCTVAPARAMLRPWRAEEERRCAYVAATRAQQRLYGLMPKADPGVYPWDAMGV